MVIGFNFSRVKKKYFDRITEAMKVYSRIIEVHQKIGPDITDITDIAKRLVAESAVETGTMTINVIGSTGSLTTIEFEPGVVQDLCEAIERLAPQDLEYKHELAWHDGNGHSHVQAALLGPSVSICIMSGRLQLGTWQQIVAINHDNKSRIRKLACVIVGE